MQAKTIIDTDRLLLTTWLEQDLDALAAMCSDPMVMEHFPNPISRTESAQLLEKINAHYAQHGYTLFATRLKENGELIGFVGLLQPAFEIPNFRSVGKPIVEIGWRLAHAHWGKGYAPEAAKAVLQHAFEVLELPEIISFTALPNKASQRVMQKIGLNRNAADDFMHPKLPKDHRLSHHLLYRLSQKDYQN